jgi:dehydrogenase/reductase SDR family member 7B
MKNGVYLNKVVWITGASSGIGAALFKAFLNEGATVIISSRRQKELESLKQQSSHSERVVVVPLDLTDSNQLISQTKMVVEQYQIDILIHNGGISQRSMAAETSIELDRQLMEVNYFGHIHMTKLVLPQMIERGCGHLVVISSLTGKWGFYLRSAYAASKHALHGYYDSLRMEVEDKGVRISIVTPGFIATDISKNALLSDGSLSGEMDPNQAKGISPDECAQQILRGLKSNKKEFGVGGRELFSLFLNRYFPRLFARILKKQSAR